MLLAVSLKGEFVPLAFCDLFYYRIKADTWARNRICFIIIKFIIRT
mgnify:CR=1 FL=1